MKMKITLLAMAVSFASNAQTTAHDLGYDKILECNVAVEGHFLDLTAVSIKQHDGKAESIMKEELNERVKWFTLARSSGEALGKNTSDIQADLIAVRKTDDGHMAELNRLDNLYTISNPDLKSAPYYKPLSTSERAAIKQKSSEILAAHQRELEELYKQCVSELPQP
jgi:hypothetical protein